MGSRASRRAVASVAAVTWSCCVAALAIAAGGSGSSGSGSAAAATAARLDPWPRRFELAEATASVFQPQVESWQANQLTFRAAVELTASDGSDHGFGVIWGQARTEVARPARQVTLQDVRLTRARFPTRPDQGASILAEIQKQVPAHLRTISLDRLEASLAAAGTLKPGGLPVRNTPPRIFVSESPAILIPIQGEPVLRPVPESDFQRVLNTRAAIFAPKDGHPFYLHVYDGWLEAPALTGPWAIASHLPRKIDEAAEKLAKRGRVDLLDGEGAHDKPSLSHGAPEIFVSTVPAELIVFKGQPDLQPIGTTSLLWATNTTSDVIVDESENDYYVLLSGRWFSSPSLDGPWRYVPGSSLPEDFRKIPSGSPAALVLAAVPGTTQAMEAAIENSVPQTATVPLHDGPTFEATTDGAPRLAPIDGTPLQYVVNSPTPIIRVDESHWYAVQAAVWFEAGSATGPWAVASEVPEVIYTIPPSSPLHYVTYVQIYGSGPGVVYEGYTPGYLGTVVDAEGVVVYGTGYAYEPWVGTVYYAAPETWDVMAQPVYNPAVGWSYGFAMGLTTAAVVDSWAEPIYYTSTWYGYPCCGSASADVYGHWGDTVTSGTRTWYSDSSGWMGEKASGTYTNSRTGTTGTYSANRSVNPYTGQAQRGYDRTFDTAGGTKGEVSREGSYDAQSGERDYTASASAKGPGGSSVERSVSASVGGGGDSVERSTTVDNARTGETHTYESGLDGNDRYASADGNVLRNDGSGWQTRTAGGWQSAAGQDTSWADREQQARSTGQGRFDGFQGGFGGGGFGQGSMGGGGFGGGGGWGGRFAGGGLGDRFGEGGGFGGGRFGGGGFGGGRGGRR